MSASLSSIPKKRLNLIKAFNWLAADLQMEYMIIKIQFINLSIPKSLTAKRDSIFSFPISTVFLTCVDLLLFNRMARNLFGLTIILLFLKSELPQTRVLVF